MTHTSRSREEQLHREIGSLTLKEIDRIPAHCSIRDAACHFRESNVSLVLIGDGPRQVITERDITRALAEGIDPADPVEEIAEHTPLWVTTTSHVIDVARMMLEHEVRHLIVLTPNGNAAGVISMRDVFEMLVPEFLFSA